ncbi:MAG TPA: MBL fold metallo-hydrolase [Vicinamibacterales bacterium]|nr:MBL fold metallo-hydrolase [Vicinamibacterales bacterium]
MRVVFLGTGTSHGVPMIGCDCEVCRSTDTRDKRTRPSIYLELDDDGRVLVDTTPDLRTQALRHDLRRLDAIFFTHAHADHVMGLDDVRRFNVISGAPIPVYGNERTLADLRRTFAYVFDPGTGKGGGLPELRLWPIAGPFCFGRQEVIPVPIQHGTRTILGFRIGRFAYLTDCSGIPEASLAQLGGLHTLVLDALRRRPHPTHFTLEQAVTMARRIGAGQTYFTHIAHDLAHAETCAALPAGMALAYDGLSLMVD